MIALKKILVATDFSELSAVALSYGCDLGRLFDAEVHVLHVVDDLGARLCGLPGGYAGDLGRLRADMEQTALEQIDARLETDSRHLLRTQSVVRTSLSPAETILAYARDAKIDCIVMGTHGRGGVAHLVMGSVAERVVRLAPCPVLTIRHPEHEFVLPDAVQALAQV
jgi:nucleotide-binding universal stress UspA family protein